MCFAWCQTHTGVQLPCRYQRDTTIKLSHTNLNHMFGRNRPTNLDHMFRRNSPIQVRNLTNFFLLSQHLILNKKKKKKKRKVCEVCDLNFTETGDPLTAAAVHVASSFAAYPHQSDDDGDLQWKKRTRFLWVSHSCFFVSQGRETTGHYQKPLQMDQSKMSELFVCNIININKYVLMIPVQSFLPDILKYDRNHVKRGKNRKKKVGNLLDGLFMWRLLKSNLLKTILNLNLLGLHACTRNSCKLQVYLSLSQQMANLDLFHYFHRKVKQ